MACVGSTLWLLHLRAACPAVVFVPPFAADYVACSLPMQSRRRRGTLLLTFASNLASPPQNERTHASFVVSWQASLKAASPLKPPRSENGRDDPPPSHPQNDVSTSGGGSGDGFHRDSSSSGGCNNGGGASGSDEGGRGPARAAEEGGVVARRALFDKTDISTPVLSAAPKEGAAAPSPSPATPAQAATPGGPTPSGFGVLSEAWGRGGGGRDLSDNDVDVNSSGRDVSPKKTAVMAVAREAWEAAAKGEKADIIGDVDGGEGVPTAAEVRRALQLCCLVMSGTRMCAMQPQRADS